MHKLLIVIALSCSLSSLATPELQAFLSQVAKKANASPQEPVTPELLNALQVSHPWALLIGYIRGDSQLQEQILSASQGLEDPWAKFIQRAHRDTRLKEHARNLILPQALSSWQETLDRSGMEMPLITALAALAIYEQSDLVVVALLDHWMTTNERKALLSTAVIEAALQPSKTTFHLVWDRFCKANGSASRPNIISLLENMVSRQQHYDAIWGILRFLDQRNLQIAILQHMILAPVVSENFLCDAFAWLIEVSVHDDYHFPTALSDAITILCRQTVNPDTHSHILHHAIRRYHLEAVRILLMNIADPNIKTGASGVVSALIRDHGSNMSQQEQNRLEQIGILLNASNRPSLLTRVRRVPHHGVPIF